MTLAVHLAPSLLRLALGGTLDLSYEAALFAEARTHEVEYAEGLRLRTTAYELTPDVVGLATGARVDLLGAYFPRVLFEDGDRGERFNLVHRARARAVWRATPIWALSGAGLLIVGPENLMRLSVPSPGQQPPELDPAPVFATIPYTRVEATAEAEAQVLPRHHVLGALTLSRDGGSDTAARAVLPLRQVARLRLQHDWTLTRVDELSSRLATNLVRFVDLPPTLSDDPTRTVWTARLGERWTRLLAPESNAWLGAGVALVGHNAREQEPMRTVPAAEAGISHRSAGRGYRLYGGLASTLGPVEERLGGAVVERLDLRAWLAWSDGRWSVRGAAAGGVVTAGELRRDRVAFGEVRAGWIVTRYVELACGARGGLLEQPRLGPARRDEWSAYVALALVDSRLPENPDDPVPR
jgi:hypothetical protein